MERLNLGSVRERQHRWDLKLPLAPTVPSLKAPDVALSDVGDPDLPGE